MKKSLAIWMGTLLCATMTTWAADGDPDLSFGTNGNGIVNTPYIPGNETYPWPVWTQAMRLQADGKIVIAGTTPWHPEGAFMRGFIAARYNTDGSVDTSFGENGWARAHFYDPAKEAIAHTVVVQADGKVVAAGFISYEQMGIARFTTNGILDTTFGSGGKVITSIDNHILECEAMALQDDGRIVIVGRWEDENSNHNSFFAARYNVDGSPDTSFGSNGMVVNDIAGSTSYDEAWDLAIQNDGRILVVGGSYVDGSTKSFAMVRYNTDGSLDTSFGSGGKVRMALPGMSAIHGRRVELEDDGRFYAAGVGRADDDSQQAVAAHFNTNGSLDTSFASNGVATLSIGRSTESDLMDFAVQRDKRIFFVISDFHRDDSSLDDVGIGRLNSDGSADTTFYGGSFHWIDMGLNGQDTARGCAIQADDKIIFAANITDGTDRTGLMRLLAKPPVLVTSAVSAIGTTSAQCGGEITDDHGEAINARGVCWNRAGNPTVADSHTTDTSNPFSSNLSGLGQQGTYFVRAYATDASGNTGYGDERVFTTTGLRSPGDALQFETADYAEIPHDASLKPTNALTVELWAYAVNWIVATNQTLVSCTQGGGYNLYLRNSGVIRGAVHGGGSYLNTEYAATNLTTGWHHFALTYDGTDARLYVDGILRDTVNGPGTISYDPDNSLILGAEAGSGTLPEGSYYSGCLDEVRLWNVARTVDQLRDNMHRELNGDETGLVAYYPLNQMGTSALDDVTTNANDGTLHNFTAWIGSSTPCADDIAGSAAGIRGVWIARTNSLDSSILSVSNAVMSGTDFRVFGHDGNALTNDTPDKPASFTWRLDRAWRVEGSGAVSGDLLFDCSGIMGLIGDTGNLRLLQDADGTFSDAMPVAGTFDIPHSTFRVPRSLTDGAYYTLGEWNGSYWVLKATAEDGGTIDPSGTVQVIEGSSTNFVITPVDYYHVADVTTNSTSVGAVTGFTWSNVTADGTIHADFAADLAAGGTPHWWLAQYGLTNGGWTFDQAETNNPDHDPFTSGDEYIADTSPTNAASYFHIVATSNLPPFTVYFDSSSNRWYTLRWNTNLVEGGWTEVTNRMGAGGLDSMSGTNNAPAEFFKLEVEMP